MVKRGERVQYYSVFKPEDGWKTAFCVQLTAEKMFKTSERLEAATADLDNRLFIKICMY